MSSIQYPVSSIQYLKFLMQIATETDFVFTLKDIFLSGQVDFKYFCIQYPVFCTSYFDSSPLIHLVITLDCFNGHFWNSNSHQKPPLKLDMKMDETYFVTNSVFSIQ